MRTLIYILYIRRVDTYCSQIFAAFSYVFSFLLIAIAENSFRFRRQAKSMKIKFQEKMVKMEFFSKSADFRHYFTCKQCQRLRRRSRDRPSGRIGRPRRVLNIRRANS